MTPDDDQHVTVDNDNPVTGSAWSTAGTAGRLVRS